MSKGQGSDKNQPDTSDQLKHKNQLLFGIMEFLSANVFPQISWSS